MAGRGKKRAAPKKEPAADAEDGATVSLETGAVIALPAANHSPKHLHVIGYLSLLHRQVHH